MVVDKFLSSEAISKSIPVFSTNRIFAYSVIGFPVCNNAPIRGKSNFAVI